MIFLLILSILKFTSQSETLKIGPIEFSKQQFKVGKGESSIAVADFNSDNHLDLAISNLEDETVHVFIGDGKGNFTDIKHFNAGKAPTDVTTADINGDGFSDIIIANHETSYISLLNGDGRGNFSHSKNSPYIVKVKPHPHMVLLSDLNNDGRDDLIIDNRTNNGLLVLPAIGNNEFKKSGTIIDVGGDPYRGFAIADINNDGQLDIVTPNTNEISVVLNIKAETLLFEKKKSITLESPFSVKLADINGDDKRDLIVASNKDFISVILGDGQGNFNASKKIVFKMPQGAKQIAIGDINGDGLRDAFFSCWNNNFLMLLGGKESFKPIYFNLITIPNPWGIELADMNEDGKDDLIITDGSNDSFLLYLSQ